MSRHGEVKPDTIHVNFTLSSCHLTMKNLVFWDYRAMSCVDHKSMHMHVMHFAIDIHIDISIFIYYL